MNSGLIASQSLVAAGSALPPAVDASKIITMPGYNPKHLKDIEELALTVNPLQRRRRPRIRRRDPSRIPRPVNCFLAYRLEKQKLITTICPGVNHREISKAVAKWWSEEPESEKDKYRMLAEQDKQRHKEKYPTYKYAPKKKRPSNSKTSRSQPSLVTSQLSAMMNPDNPFESFLCSPTSYEQPLCQPLDPIYHPTEPLCQPSQVLMEAPTSFDPSFNYHLQGSNDALFGDYVATPGDSTVAQNGCYYNIADTYPTGAFWNSLVQPQHYGTPSLSTTPSTVHMSPVYGSTTYANELPTTVRMSDIIRPTAKDMLSIYPSNQNTDDYGASTDTLPSFDSFSGLDQPVFQGSDFSAGALIDPLYPSQPHFDQYASPFA